MKATMVNETAGANSFDENYTKIDENYTKMDENYAKMEENYMKMEDNFSKMEENDTKMEDNYAKMDEIHAKMGEKYTKIDENYTKMDGDYIKMDEDYTKMYEEYTKMEANDEYDVPDKNTDDVRIEYTRMTFDANVYQDVTGSHMTNAKNDIVGTTGLVPDNSHTRDSLSTNNFENSNKGATVLNEAFAQIGSANRDNRYDELQIQKAYPNEMTGLVIDTDCGKDVIAVSRNLDETNQEQSINLLQFRCHLCNSSFEFRLPSLIHIATKHETQWLELSNKNKIGNIAEFSQRVDKALAKNIQKRAKTRYNKEPNGNKDGFTPKTTSNDLAIMWSCSLCPSSFKWPDYHNKHVDMIHRNLKDIHRGT